MLRKFKIALPLMAFVMTIVVVASAFTDNPQPKAVAVGTMYWFPTNSSGALLNNTITISGHTVKPCDGDGDYCARGFTESQVIDNADGTVTLNVNPEQGVPSFRE